MPIVNCSQCGIETNKPSYDIRVKKNLFCSRQCHSEFMKVRPEYTCENCGKNFKRKKSTAEKSIKTFCSNRCKYEYQDKRQQKQCENCGSTFKVTNHKASNAKYCSYKCMGEKMKKEICMSCDYCQKEYVTIPFKVERNKKNYCSFNCKLKDWDTRIMVSCKNCEQTFLRRKKAVNEFGFNFCCRDCFFKYYIPIQTQELKWSYSEEYKSLRKRLTDTHRYRRWRKAVLLKYDGKCSVYSSKEHLHVHHIQSLYSICYQYGYDYEKIISSEIFTDIDNGLLLCYKCHSDIHFNNGGNAK